MGGFLNCSKVIVMYSRMKVLNFKNVDLKKTHVTKISKKFEFLVTGQSVLPPPYEESMIAIYSSFCLKLIILVFSLVCILRLQSVCNISHCISPVFELALLEQEGLHADHQSTITTQSFCKNGGKGFYSNPTILFSRTILCI